MKQYHNYPFLRLWQLLLVGLLVVPSLSFAITIEQVPRPDNEPVIDEANLLSDTDEQALIQQITDLHNTTGDYIVVVTLPSIKDTHLTPKEYATKLFETWQIGNKDKDNGLLILDVADVRRLEMETGYGLEGALPDGVLKRIQTEQIVPAFKQGDYAKGFEQGISEIGKRLVVEQQTYGNQDRTSKKPSNFWYDYWVTSGLFSVIFVASFFYQRGSKRLDYYKNNSNFSGTEKKGLETTDGLEAILFFAGSLVLGIGGFFFFLFSQKGWLLSLQYALAMIAGCIGLASLLYLRHPTTHHKFWQAQPIDLWYFYDITNPKYSILGLVVRGLFSPVFAIGILPYVLKQKNLRHHARSCAKCHHEMSLIPSEKANKALSRFYQQEIARGFAEYDVWLCQQCKYHRILRYPTNNLTPSYCVCPQCQQTTMYLVNFKELQPPTYEAEGLGLKIYDCLACGYHQETETVIDRKVHIQSNSSDSGSSWSSSSSSDSGYSSSDGGSSGGGGAGSDY